MPAPTRQPPQQKSYGQQPIDHLIADYRVLRVMSRGSLGTLHVAEDTGSGAVVLLRVLPRKLSASPKIREVLDKDLLKLERVDHRNVTRVQRRGVTDGRLFYVLDFPSSVTLLDFVRERGALRGLELLWLAAGLASGLAALHAQGLAHGNLWPAKVALSHLGPVLVDLSWTARLRGSNPTWQNDLVDLAGTLIYAATGTHPPPETRNDVHPLPAGVPGPVLRLLDAIRVAPDRRPPTGQLADDLQAQLDELLLEGSGPLEPLYGQLERVAEALPGLGDPREESGGIVLPTQPIGLATMVEPRDPDTEPEDSPEAPSGRGGVTRALPEAAKPSRAAPRRKANDPPDIHRLRPGLHVQQIRLLGEGGMGVVHLVRDPVLQRQAALKLVRGMSRIRLSRFQRETSVTARLDHPSIPPVFEAGTVDDHPYLLMRFVDGESLSEILARRPPNQSHPEEQTRRLLHALLRVGEAVGYAHSRRVVHRDLKPANIMIGAFGEVFVMDWGLARDLSESAEEDARARSQLANELEPGDIQQGLTQEGTILGTPGYMAPEQARGEDIDVQADVFSLGAILAEILTGKPPFTGPTPLAVLGLNRAGEVEFPRQRYRDVNLELDAIARKALAPECEDRYASTEEFVADLRAFFEGKNVSVYSYNQLERTWRWVRRHPSWFSAALATILLSVGIPLSLWRARLQKISDLVASGEIQTTSFSDEVDEVDRLVSETLDREWAQTLILDQRLQRERLENEGDVQARIQIAKGDMLARVAELAERGSEPLRLFGNALELEPANRDASEGLEEASFLLDRVKELRERTQALALISMGKFLLKQSGGKNSGFLEDAREKFLEARAYQKSIRLEENRPSYLLRTVDDALDRLQLESEDATVQAMAMEQANRHRAQGIRHMDEEQWMEAQAEFIKALAFDHPEAKNDLLEVEEKLIEQREAERKRVRSEESRTLADQAYVLLNNKPDGKARQEARSLLIQALGFDGTNEKAQRGLVWIDRLIRKLEERREQKQQEEQAGQQLGEARRKIRLARSQVAGNFDPDSIRETYLDGLAAYDRAQFLLPNHSGIQSERGQVTTEFAEHLTRWGMHDLAVYFLKSGGLDPEGDTSPVASLEDEVIVVQEADLERIRQAFGGGTVRVQPTKCFEPIRELLHSLGKRYEVMIQVRSSTLSEADGPPKVLATGLWVRVTDTETQTVFPTARIVFEGGPYNRPVMVTAKGHRLITPWDRAHNLDQARYIEAVDAAVRERIGRAKRSQ